MEIDGPVAHDLAATGAIDASPVLFVVASPKADLASAEDEVAPVPIWSSEGRPLDAVLAAPGQPAPVSLQGEWLAAARALPDDAAAEAPPLGADGAPDAQLAPELVPAQSTMTPGVRLGPPAPAPARPLPTGDAEQVLRQQRSTIEWVVAPLVMLALLAAVLAGGRRSGRRRLRKVWHGQADPLTRAGPSPG